MELIIIIALAIGAYLVWTTFMRKQETPADLVVVDQVAYKVEPPAVIPVAGLMVETAPAAMPVGIEAVMAAPTAKVPRAPKVKPPAKPAARTAAKKAVATKPRAKRAV